MRTLTLILLVCLLAFSCVPATKFKALEEQQKLTSRERDEIRKQKEKLNVDFTELKAKLEKSSMANEQLISDSSRLYNSLIATRDEVKHYQTLNAELQENQLKLLKGKDLEAAKLLNQLEETRKELNAKENALVEREKNINKLSLEIDRKDVKVKDLENRVRKNDSIVDALKTKINNALLGFMNNGLSVKVLNGKVYLSLDEELMFQSGSIAVDKKGVEALKGLAKVLEQNTDINITIEGHTDNVPYKSTVDKGIKDNWDLSVLRATSIVRILLDNSSIDPTRLISSGRGEFMPVASNSNAQTRQKNRRTEIILTPKIDEVLKILGN